jgi:hypothetical protein
VLSAWTAGVWFPPRPAIAVMPFLFWHPRFLRIFASPCGLSPRTQPTYSSIGSFDLLASHSLLVHWGDHLHLRASNVHVSLFWARGVGLCSVAEQYLFTHGHPFFVTPLSGFESATLHGLLSVGICISCVFNPRVTQMIQLSLHSALPFHTPEPSFSSHVFCRVMLS